MAGIGFSLKKLFKKKGVFHFCKAYGYSSIVTIGPMLLGVALLVGVSMISDIGGMSGHDRELLNCMLTYSLLIALMVTTWFNMVVTRYVSDMLYEGKDEKVMPSFFGSVAIELVICFVVYGTFLIFAGATLLQSLLCLWLALVLVVVWTEMIYLTAIKDYQSIVLTFTISLMFGLLLALVGVLIGVTSIESLLMCVIIAYGILAVRQLELMLDYFPKSEGSHYSFLRWFDKYPTLSISGGMVRVGLFSHLIIMYFGPLRVQVQGLFYGAPEYDVPALLAFFSLLITTVSFVISVEVNFYPKYSNYYGLFADRGAIKDIELAGKEMIDMLQRELTYLGLKQVFTTILFVVIGPSIIESIMPGISSLSMMIFKFLCVGYGTYAIANSIMLMQLYFEDYAGAFVSTILFALVSSGVTIWQILYGSTKYFGVGFILGSVVFYFCSLLRMNWYVGRLPYFLLARQSLLPGRERGFFTWISDKLEERQEKKAGKGAVKVISGILLVFLIPAVMSLAGCTGKMANPEEEVESSIDGESFKEAPSAVEVMKVEKAENREGNLRDNKSLYDGYEDETSVITMYLTVSRGNEADSSDHSWQEINTYSVYDYENMGVDRYKVEGLLQIDETGEGIDEDSYGYGEVVPNVSVQVRGQTSSKSNQKNFKIRIKDGKDEFRGQRTLDLNKHKGEHYRFVNKLCYDLIKPIPQMIGGRTQFVHLFVKDMTDSEEAEFEDYGLFTMVEQVNRTYLKSHGLDENGHLYKVSFFEWNEYEEVMVPVDDPDFDQAKFDRYLECKGDRDPSKLQHVIEEINNYTIPIEKIVEEHFDTENICYWMAFNILNGNTDVGARNLFLYSPLNSQKFYMICWDMDASFKAHYHEWRGEHGGESWEQGMTKFLGLVLIKRMMREEQYRTMLEEAVEDLYRHYVNPKIVSEKIQKYKEVTMQYVFSDPDAKYERVFNPELYDEMSSLVATEVDDNYRIFWENMKCPWPFFVDEPLLKEDSDEVTLSWRASYDYLGEDITYDYILARDINFTDVIKEGHGLTVPIATAPILPQGIYYLHVEAKNESGYVMDCFDYTKDPGHGKKYGCYCFVVEPDGTIKPYQ